MVANVLAGLPPLRLEYWPLPTAIGVFAAVAVPVVWMGMRSLAGLGPTRQRVAIGVRLTLLGAIVLALAGLRAQWRVHDLEVMVVRDVSRSTRNSGATAGVDEWVKGATAEKRPADDRVGAVAFAGAARVEAVPAVAAAKRGATSTVPLPDGTDLAAGLQLALASFGGDAMHRVVLVTDGNANRGATEDAIAAAASQHVPVDVYPLRYDVRHEIVVDRLVAPPHKRAGEPFTLDVVVRSVNDGPVEAKLRVDDGGVPLPVADGGAVMLAPGANVFHVPVGPPGTSGAHQFHAAVDATGPDAAANDTLSDNNGADAVTVVRGSGRVLYVDHVPGGRGERLRDALVGRGLEVGEADHVDVDRFPTSALALAGYDAVVLANVPRGAGGLSEQQGADLARYVTDLGGGLVVVGGPEALGAGGWQGSKLAEVLPVDLDVPAERQIPRGALVLVLDRSGSMADSIGGTRSKEEVVAEAAGLAVSALSKKDLAGVIAFDTDPKWIVPLGPNTDAAATGRAVKEIVPYGGTSIGPALAAAVDALAGLPPYEASVKHVLLLTDGESQPDDYDAILRRAAAAHVTVSTIGVGADQDAKLLQQLAAGGHGRYYSVSDPRVIPQVFVTEATIVRRSLIQEDPDGFAVGATATAGDMPVLRGVGQLPPVFGMVLTSPKPGATDAAIGLVAGPKRDPLVAVGRSGLGRVAVVTTDADPGAWGANWAASDGYAKFWSQAVRGVARSAADDRFSMDVTRDGTRGKIVVEGVDRDGSGMEFLAVAGRVIGPAGDDRGDGSGTGKLIDVKLDQVGPGRYEGTFDAAAPGAYAVALECSGPTGGGVLYGGLVAGRSPESADLKSNDALLGRIVTATGGRMLTDDPTAADLFSREGLADRTGSVPLRDLLLATAMGLLIVDVATRRIAWDAAALRGYAGGVVGYVQSFTTTRKVETRSSVEALQRVRGTTGVKVAEVPVKAAKPTVVKVPAGERAAPKAAQSGSSMGSLMEAKRRARERQ